MKAYDKLGLQMNYYFYDLETSGINPRVQRIMQFAGQRTNENFEPVGESQNWLVKLTEEVLPDPEAVLLTGITPQKTVEEGFSEAQFLKMFETEICQPDTIIVGFNNVRFDDEFMRFTLWRNFYDAYEWQYRDGRSRWDMLDVIRMVRALRPDGIAWPVDKDGKPTNRLEKLTKENKLDHQNAHDALADVRATIAVSKLIHDKQPKIYDFLLGLRSKKKILEMVDSSQPFVYTSGRYSSKWLHTTVAVVVGEAEYEGRLVYDLRFDPSELADLTDQELTQILFNRDEEKPNPILKMLKPNTCPAIAPLGVLDADSSSRLELDIKKLELNLQNLKQNRDLIKRLVKLYKAGLEQQRAKYVTSEDCDTSLYDGFISDADKKITASVVATDGLKITELNPQFQDQRLKDLWPRYLARNYGKLDDSLTEAWEKYRSERLVKGCQPGQIPLGAYFERLSELGSVKTSDQDQYLLTELQLWGESIAPVNDQ